MINERSSAKAQAKAVVNRAAAVQEGAEAKGRYIVECRGADGFLKWFDVINNVVCTEGKNVMLDAALAGSAYTVTGPFMGLISDDTFSAVAAGDTAAQINGSNGWKEAGNAQDPTYSGTRKTCAWSAASAGAKALSAACSFSITSSGIVEGVFIVFSSGAVNTIDSAAGKLWSAGLFTSPKSVDNGDVLSVTYAASL